MRDKRLEDLSDKVRSGEPIDFEEALEVINYQTRKKSLLDKFIGWWRFN